MGRSAGVRLKQRVRRSCAGGEKGGKAGSEADVAMWNMTAVSSVNSAHGGFARPISITVHASDHTSAGVPCPAWRITSGAIQYGVPCTDLFRVTFSVCIALLHPKSASLHTPFVSTRMLAPLMSRCTTWLSWR